MGVSTQKFSAPSSTPIFEKLSAPAPQTPRTTSSRFKDLVHRFHPESLKPSKAPSSGSESKPRPSVASAAGVTSLTSSEHPSPRRPKEPSLGSTSATKPCQKENQVTYVPQMPSSDQNYASPHIGVSITQNYHKGKAATYNFRETHSLSTITS